MFAGQEFVVKGGDLQGPKKRVGVIGCGISGLVSLKTALEYGHDVIGYERMPQIGGIWTFETNNTSEGYTTHSDDSVPCYPMYSTLMTNSSKYLTIFSDFMPLEESKGEFPTQKEVGGYAQAYASNFNLMAKIKLNSHVSKLDKKGSKWFVHYRSGEGEEKVDEFDFVMVCTGGFQYPRQYEIKGSENFEGLILFGSQVRDGGKLLNDKNVFLIGGSMFAGEVLSMALPDTVKKMYVHFTDRDKTASVWTFERYVKSVYGDKRSLALCINRENAFLNAPDAQVMIGQIMYPLQKCSPDATFNIPNDIVNITDVKAYNAAKKSGVLDVVGAIRNVDGKTIFLQNGDVLKDIDIIIIAKGFHRSFPFLDNIWPREEQNKFEMYNYTISPAPQLDGLAFMLMIFTPALSFPLAELQSRWFVHKIVSRTYDNQDHRIYSSTERRNMKECILKKRSLLPKDAPFSYIDFVYLVCDHFATDIGANPPNFKELITSGDEKQIELGVALAYGPIYPMQFRIQGPHSWPKAAEEFLKQTKEFLGEHFDEYVEKVKKNQLPRSGYLDPSKGPYNEY